MKTEIERGNAKEIFSVLSIFCNDDKSIFMIRKNGRIIAICQDIEDAHVIISALHQTINFTNEMK